jgi:hypothetical protein
MLTISRDHHPYDRASYNGEWLQDKNKDHDSTLSDLNLLSRELESEPDFDIQTTPHLTDPLPPSEETSYWAVPSYPSLYR